MADRSPCFAALDFGTGGGKCIIFDVDGRRLAAARTAWSFTRAPSEHDHLTPGFSFDPETTWSTLARCARDAMAESDLEPGDIHGVTSTSLRLGTVLLDEKGREVYCAPNMDGRGFGGALELIEKISREELVRTTGHWPPFLSSAARLLAYRHGPDASRVRHALSLNDWIAYRLSGEIAAEASNAGETYFLDIAKRDWSEQILSTLEVEPATLPGLVESGSQIGRVSAEAAEVTGFRPGTPVYAGGADTQCALFGSRVRDAHHAAAVLGTTAPVMAVCNEPPVNTSGRLWAGCHVLPERWTLESNAAEVGNAWDWLLGLVGLEGEFRYEEAERLMAATPDSPEPLIAFAQPQIFDLDNYNPQRLTGFGFRYNGFPGSVGPTRGQLLRAFVRNVAFAVRANLEQIEEHLGDPVASLSLTGGLTRSKALQREFCRTIHRPLFLAEEPESTALGAVALASVGAGAYADTSAALEAMVRCKTLYAEDALMPAYDEQYATWRSVYAVAMQTSL